MKTIPGNSVIREFEYKVAEYCNARYALSVCNATIGILGVFHALGLKGAEVITTPLTWHGAISGLTMLDCRLQFCDVEEATLTLNPEKLEEQITSNTKAIFTADFLGYPARLDKVKEICNKHQLLLIHDAASSFGSMYKKHFSGHYADVTVLSFGAKKLFTIGQGGCIVTNDRTIFRKLLMGLSHPERQDIQASFKNPFVLNTDINPLAAEYGLRTFEQQVEKIIQRQEKIAAWLKRLGIETGLKDDLPNFYKVVCQSKFKKSFEKYPTAIIDRLPFNKLIYQEPAFIKLSLPEPLHCAIAESAFNRFLTVQTNDLC